MRGIGFYCILFYFILFYFILFLFFFYFYFYFYFIQTSWRSCEDSLAVHRYGDDLASRWSAGCQRPTNLCVHVVFANKYTGGRIYISLHAAAGRPICVYTYLYIYAYIYMYIYIRVGIFREHGT
jgi:hypothetical protein